MCFINLPLRINVSHFPSHYHFVSSRLVFSFLWFFLSFLLVFSEHHQFCNIACSYALQLHSVVLQINDSLDQAFYDWLRLASTLPDNCHLVGRLRRRAISIALINVRYQIKFFSHYTCLKRKVKSRETKAADVLGKCEQCRKKGCIMSA